MKLDDFFGLDLNKIPFDINRYTDMLGIRRTIENTGQVQRLLASFGKDSPYVDLAKRQQTLLHFKTLLSQDFLPFDKFHEVKDVNTATDKDRRYNAEERLLRIVLSIAAGEKYLTLEADGFKPDTQVLRACNKYADEKYDRLRQILDERSTSVMEAFKQDKEKLDQQQVKEKKGFFGKLFGD